MGKARAAFEAVGVFGRDGLQAVEVLEIKARQLAADAARRVSDTCIVKKQQKNIKYKGE